MGFNHSSKPTISATSPGFIIWQWAPTGHALNAHPNTRILCRTNEGNVNAHKPPGYTTYGSTPSGAARRVVDHYEAQQWPDTPMYLQTFGQEESSYVLLRHTGDSVLNPSGTILAPEDAFYYASGYLACKPAAREFVSGLIYEFNARAPSGFVPKLYAGNFEQFNREQQAVRGKDGVNPVGWFTSALADTRFNTEVLYNGMTLSGLWASRPSGLTYDDDFLVGGGNATNERFVREWFRPTRHQIGSQAWKNLLWDDLRANFSGIQCGNVYINNNLTSGNPWYDGAESYVFYYQTGMLIDYGLMRTNGGDIAEWGNAGETEQSVFHRLNHLNLISVSGANTNIRQVVFTNSPNMVGFTYPNITRWDSKHEYVDVLRHNVYELLLFTNGDSSTWGDSEYSDILWSINASLNEFASGHLTVVSGIINQWGNELVIRGNHSWPTGWNQPSLTSGVVPTISLTGANLSVTLTQKAANYNVYFNSLNWYCKYDISPPISKSSGTLVANWAGVLATDTRGHSIPVGSSILENRSLVDVNGWIHSDQRSLRTDCGVPSGSIASGDAFLKAWWRLTDLNLSDGENVVVIPDKSISQNSGVPVFGTHIYRTGLTPNGGGVLENSDVFAPAPGQYSTYQVGNLKHNCTGNFTAFIVSKPTVFKSSNAAIFSINDTLLVLKHNLLSHTDNSASGWYFNINASGSNKVVSSHEFYANDEWAVHAAKYDGSLMTVWSLGVPTSGSITSPLSVSGQAYLCAQPDGDNGFIGYIAEFVFYSSGLSNDRILNICSYLMKQHGITPRQVYCSVSGSIDQYGFSSGNPTTPSGSIARSIVRNNMGDHLYYKAGDIFGTGINQGFIPILAGFSSGYPNIYGAYGSSTSRPKFLLNNTNHIGANYSGSSLSNIYIGGIEFNSPYRDMGHSAFAGTGIVPSGKGISLFADYLDSVFIEDVKCNNLSNGINLIGNSGNNIFINRCIINRIYNLGTDTSGALLNTHGIFAKIPNGQLYIKDTILNECGWASGTDFNSFPTGLKPQSNDNSHAVYSYNATNMPVNLHSCLISYPSANGAKLYNGGEISKSVFYNCPIGITFSSVTGQIVPPNLAWKNMFLGGGTIQSSGGRNWGILVTNALNTVIHSCVLANTLPLMGSGFAIGLDRQLSNTSGFVSSGLSVLIKDNKIFNWYNKPIFRSNILSSGAGLGGGTTHIYEINIENNNIHISGTPEFLDPDSHPYLMYWDRASMTGIALSGNTYYSNIVNTATGFFFTPSGYTITGWMGLVANNDTGSLWSQKFFRNIRRSPGEFELQLGGSNIDFEYITRMLERERNSWDNNGDIDNLNDFIIAGFDIIAEGEVGGDGGISFGGYGLNHLQALHCLLFRR